EFVVGAHDRPRVHAADPVGSPVLPRLGANLAGPRDGMEDPSMRARPYVKSTDVTRRHVPTHWPALDRRANDDQVADHQWRGGDRVPLAIDRTPEPLSEIDSSIDAEARDRGAGPGIKGNEKRVARADEDPRVAAVGPVSHAAMHIAEIGRCAVNPYLRIVDPERAAADRVDGGHLADRGADVQHAAHHQRSCLVRPGLDVRLACYQLGIRRRPAPRDTELANVVARYLTERGVACVRV